MRRDARKVHLLAAQFEGAGRISLCGRYRTTDPYDALARLRMTSAVTCKHCKDRHRRGETTPPVRAGAVA